MRYGSPIDLVAHKLLVVCSLKGELLAVKTPVCFSIVGSESQLLYIFKMFFFGIMNCIGMNRATQYILVLNRKKQERNGQ